MRIGIHGFITDRSVSVVDVARAIADRRFHSLYLPDHTHYPVATLSPVRGREDLLREEYRRIADPIVSLAAAATEQRVALGTGALLVAQHDPIRLAKQIATLERLAPSRLVLGVGFGWSEFEAQDHGVDFGSRVERAVEHLQVMRRLWLDEIASFSGRFVEMRDSYSWPKPTAGIPVLLAGRGGRRLSELIAEHADGWMPLYREGLAPSIAQLRQVVHDAGRVERPQVIVLGTPITDTAIREVFSLDIEEAVFRVELSTHARMERDLDELSQALESHWRS